MNSHEPPREPKVIKREIVPSLVSSMMKESKLPYSIQQYENTHSESSIDTNIEKILRDNQQLREDISKVNLNVQKLEQKIRTDTKKEEILDVEILDLKQQLQATKEYYELAKSENQDIEDKDNKETGMVKKKISEIDSQIDIYKQKCKALRIKMIDEGGKKEKSVEKNIISPTAQYFASLLTTIRDEAPTQSHHVFSEKKPAYSYTSHLSALPTPNLYSLTSPNSFSSTSYKAPSIPAFRANSSRPGQISNFPSSFDRSQALLSGPLSSKLTAPQNSFAASKLASLKLSLNIS